MINRALFASVATVLVAVVLTGSQSGTRAVTYSDEAIQSVRALLRTNSDDAAIQLLDDAVRVSGASAEVVERAAIAWSSRVRPIRDRILAGLMASPDDTSRVRAFVVGSTCDAFKEASRWPDGIVPREQLDRIIETNRLSSGLPPIVGMASLVADLSASISAALADGDIGGSVPGLAQTLTCAVAAG
jgi:hypothetical protein